MDQPATPRDPTALPVRVPLASRPLGVMETLGTARRNLLELIPEIATRQPMVSGRTVKRWHMVMDPGANRRILKDALGTYPKSDVTKLILRPAIGESLFVAEGAHWLWQRRAAAPAFSPRHVEALAPVMTAAAERAARRIGQTAGRQANLFDEMVTATFEVIADVTLSGTPAFDRAEVHRAINAYIDTTAKVSLLDIIGAPTWVPRLSRLRAGPVLRTMRSMADRAIAERRGTGPSLPPDLLDLLLEGADPETGRRMSTAELRDNLLTFIVAGHETTALTLAWALYLCAFDPSIQIRARAEASAVLGNRAAQVTDLPALSLCRRIIDETLRLYPPAAFLSRTARGPDRLCGREIRRGDTVMLPIYALHRNHLLWPDPDRFDPDRFLDPDRIDRFAYLPFGGGPRICIGASFALQEATIILATLLARFRFEPVAGRDPEPALILTLRPEGGVWLCATPA
ncbi:MAG: cytochrome P450 [Defluviimonas sp.]|uniref:cytochrome P450 n=1 Tax=Albidovulum sp. TaxID=1872424 RepID=UPI001DABEBFC|nr:cytochrome P450 [Paracoccaceae bacterium]MCC0063061.1 cytochrome P450 [Defluviimonas sp.]